jgi:hypothetical protein
MREELNTFILSDKILNFRSQWKNHVLRMEDRKIPKKILTYNPRRRRDIGRPQLRWKDQFTVQEDGTGQVWPNS